MKITILLSVLALSLAQAGETIRIAIGTQDTTINCAAGGPVVRELNLLEKCLPHDGNYKDVKYEITWLNLPTGAQLNSEILANRLDIVSMADFPSIVGHDAFLRQNNGIKTVYIASLSSGLQGAGNALLVPETSAVQDVKELKGKTVSVPFASTAHAFLLRAVKDQGWDPEKDITIITQTPEVGGSALKSGQIDAHANFVPFGELFPFRGFARKILDGSSTGAPTTHGIQVRSDFAEKYPEIVVAYLKSTLEGDRLLREDPESLAEKYEKWTGIEAEVFYSFHGPHGIQTRDYTFKPEVLKAIAGAAETLKILKKTSHDIKVSEFVDDRYIRQAAKELGLDYDARLKDYSAVPFNSKDFVTGEALVDAKNAGQVWVDGEEKVRLYKDVPSTFIALNELEKGGKTVRVAFVHDRETGLKLFADKVWYIRNGNDIAAFLEKSSAEKWAQTNNGNLLTYAEARKFVGGERFAQAR
ncbi:MAG TPA: ABC transporter substrate-binding protein [Terrimicrobiaceae bacterium]